MPFASYRRAFRLCPLLLAALCSAPVAAESDAGTAAEAAVPAAAAVAAPAAAVETFGGVGAALQIDGRYARVSQLVPGGSAANSGQLQVGERIVGVGEQSGEMVNVIAMPLPDLVGRIRGPVGSQVRLQVLAPDTEDLARARVVTLERAVVTAALPAATAAPAEVSALPPVPVAAPTTAGDIAAQCSKKYAAMKLCDQVPSFGATVCRSQVNKTYKHVACSLIQ